MQAAIAATANRPKNAQDRLYVALDVPTVDDARALVRALEPRVTGFKIGLELVMAGGLALASELAGRGRRVFLDMKLLDIPNTVEKAVANAARSGATLLTVHGTDTKTLAAAVNGRGSSDLKLLAITVLTSLDDGDVREQGSAMSAQDLVVHRAGLAAKAGFDGVIASAQEVKAIRARHGDRLLVITPGIRPLGSGAVDQARVMTPTDAIRAGATALVVGRPITAAVRPADAAAAVLEEIAAALDAG